MTFVESSMVAFHKARKSRQYLKFRDKIAYVGGSSFRRRPLPFVDHRSCGPSISATLVDADTVYIACNVGLAKVRETKKMFALKVDTVCSGGKGGIDRAERARRVKAEASVHCTNQVMLMWLEDSHHIGWSKPYGAPPDYILFSILQRIACLGTCMKMMA